MPNFAQPNDLCALIASDCGGAYIAFAGHLLYAAEQMLVVAEGLWPIFENQIAPHRDHLCSAVALGDHARSLVQRPHAGCAGYVQIGVAARSPQAAHIRGECGPCSLARRVGLR